MKWERCGRRRTWGLSVPIIALRNDGDGARAPREPPELAVVRERCAGPAASNFLNRLGDVFADGT